MPHRANEITYYDELGVAPDASPEHIRDSFRLLVRLLHPDQQTDQQLKDSAERQMRKLNRIYAVLSDPDRRCRYDDSLEEDRLAPTIIFSPPSEMNAQRLMARFAWVGAIVIAVAILVWLAADSTVAQPLQSLEVPESAPRAATAGAGADDSAAEIEELRSDLRVAQAERDAAIRELTRSRDVAAKALSFEPRMETPLTTLQPPPLSATIADPPAPPEAAAAAFMQKPAPDHAARQPAPPAKPFAGFWFYTRPAQGQHNSNSALYPPEFIEASISEEGGVVHGKYRARYQIVDRAIPPDVTFQFTGTPIGRGLVCPWTGPGGAKGRITLKIIGDNGMQVDWNTRELGSTQGLVVGTAKLTRRID